MGTYSYAKLCSNSADCELHDTIFKTAYNFKTGPDFYAPYASGIRDVKEVTKRHVIEHFIRATKVEYYTELEDVPFILETINGKSYDIFTGEENVFNGDRSQYDEYFHTYNQTYLPHLYLAGVCQIQPQDVAKILDGFQKEDIERYIQKKQLLDSYIRDAYERHVRDVNYKKACEQKRYDDSQKLIRDFKEKFRY